MKSTRRWFGSVLPMAAMATLLSCGHGPGMPTPDAGTPIRCGGIAGFVCPDNLMCVDDPGDDCDPGNGGADCGGICVKSERCEARWSDPARDYKARSQEACMVVRFACPVGSEYFSDPCGCGCLRTGK